MQSKTGREAVEEEPSFTVLHKGTHTQNVTHIPKPTPNSQGLHSPGSSTKTATMKNRKSQEI